VNNRHGNPTALNRHDRKRGMQPRETTCRACKTDLGTVPVLAFDVSTVLRGFLELGKQSGTFVIRAHGVYGGRQTVVCPDCGAYAYHIAITDYYTLPETEFFEAGEDPDIVDLVIDFTDPI